MKKALTLILASGIFLNSCMNRQNILHNRDNGKITEEPIYEDIFKGYDCIDLGEDRQVLFIQMEITDETTDVLWDGLKEEGMEYLELIYEGGIICKDKYPFSKTKRGIRPLYSLIDHNNDGKFNEEDYYVNYKTKKEVTNPEKGQKLLNRLRSYFLENEKITPK